MIHLLKSSNGLLSGSRYVLSNDATGRYYQVTDNGIFLPKPLTDQGGKTGFYYDGKGMAYFDNSGFQAKNAFIKYAGNYYYFDKEGYMLTGRQDVDGKTYFFLPNGIQLRDSIYQQDGKYYYFGEQYKDGYFVFDVPKEGTSETEAKFRYFSPTGEMAVGLTHAGGGLQYFDENGFQAKGTKYVTPDGKLYFFDKNSGNAYTNRWAEIDGIWYEFNDQGYAQAKKGEFYTDIIADELNVKEVKFADDVESFISYSFKPQLRTVGPKYGKLLGGIKQALTDIDGTAAMNELRTNGVLKLDINGNDVELTEEDLLIETAQTEGYVSESDGETSVVLDTNLTPELIEEGFVREIISKIQTMRKEAGFEVMDKIVVYAHGNDKIQEVMKAHEDEIKSEVLADEMVLGETDGYVKEWNINKEAVTMGVKKL